jgi:hypothetical protein
MPVKPTTRPEPRASKRVATEQTARDPYAEAIATDPRFTEAPKTAKGFIIGGVPQR